MGMRTVAAWAAQALWGLPQFVVGGLIWLACVLRGRRHLRYRTALVTFWGLGRGLSLGPFVFVPRTYAPAATRGLMAHEYGHTLQSLVLGPAYLPAIVVPSLVWAGTPALERRRSERRMSYYGFYTERWANRLALRVTGDVPEGASRDDLARWGVRR